MPTFVTDKLGNEAFTLRRKLRKHNVGVPGRQRVLTDLIPINVGVPLFV